MLNIEPNIQRDAQEYKTFCPNPFTKLILNSLGDVSMCCHQIEQIGKLDEDSNLLDIWRNAIANEIRDITLKGDLHPHCTSWNTCPFICKERTAYPLYRFKNSLYPIHIEICLPDKHCNVGGENPTKENPACIMCKRNFEKPYQQDLTDLFCRKVKPLLPYLKCLSVLGTAEPFWKDAVFTIFDKLEFFRYKDQIEFVTNTNGICLTESTTNRFFNEVEYSDLSWSLDSATPETHMKIRRLNTFDTVVKNLKRWLLMREDFGGKKKHKVSIYNNINLLNVHEMTKMVEMAYELRVDKLTVLPTHDQSGVVDLKELVLNEKNVKVFKKAALDAKQRAKELGVDLFMMSSFEVVPPSVASLSQKPSQEGGNLVQLEIP